MVNLSEIVIHSKIYTAIRPVIATNMMSSTEVHNVSQRCQRTEPQP